MVSAVVSVVSEVVSALAVVEVSVVEVSGGGSVVEVTGGGSLVEVLDGVEVESACESEPVVTLAGPVVGSIDEVFVPVVSPLVVVSVVVPLSPPPPHAAVIRRRAPRVVTVQVCISAACRSPCAAPW